MRRRKITDDDLPPEEADLSYIVPELRALARPIGSLTLDPENANDHDARSVTEIAASLKKYSVRKPITAQIGSSLGPNVVRTGNGVVMAAKQLGWAYLPVILVKESDEDATGWAIADNRIPQLSEMNFTKLAELVEKYSLDPDKHALGYSAEELAAILSTRPWDESEEDPNGDQAAAAAAAAGAKDLAVIIKVKVIDVTNRAKVQAKIAELLVSPELKGLAKLV